MLQRSFAKFGRFHKVVGNTAYGFAFVSTVNGEPYFDTGNGEFSDHIPVDSIESVSAEFMKASRVGLDMHEGAQVADVLYAMPMIDEILESNGVTSAKQGLLIGWTTPDTDLLAKVATGERTGFSIGGIVTAWDIVDVDGKVIESVRNSEKRFGPDAIAKAVGYDGKDGKLKRRVFRSWKLYEISTVDRPMQEPATIGIVKGRAQVGYRVLKVLARVIRKDAILTSSEAGHQHTIDPSCCENGEGRTSYERMSDEDYGHDHAWVRNEDGTITVAENMGHGHTVDGSVTAPGPEGAEQPNTAVVIAARAGGAGNLRPGSAPRTVKHTQEPPTMDPKDVKISEQQKRIEFLEKVLKLPDAHRLHYNKLAVSGAVNDAVAFVEKSAGDRDRDIKDADAADPVVYTSKRTNKAYRASQQELADLAKDSDAQADEVAKAREERDSARFSKLATESFGHLALKSKKGKDGYDDGVALAKAIYSIADEAQRDRILDTLKAADAIAAGNYEPQGVETQAGAEGDDEEEPAAPTKKLGDNKAAAELTKMAEALATKEGIHPLVAKKRLIETNPVAKRLASESLAFDAKKKRAAQARMH